MRAQRPSSSKKHSNLKDCQSHDPTTTDVVLARKTIQTKKMNTEQLVSSSQATLNNVSISGQTVFPDNFHDQLYDHFVRTGQPMRVPRIVADSVTSQGMLWAKNNVNVDNLTTDGCIDARGNMNCFGVVHFYGPIKIHGSFEVDQDITTRVSHSLLSHVTEPIITKNETKEKEKETVTRTPSTTSPIPSTTSPKPSITPTIPSTIISSPPMEKVIRETIQEINSIPVQTFHCKSLVVDQIKAKDSIETKQVSTQRLFSYTHNVKELVAETLQAINIIIHDNLTTNHLESTTAQIGSLHIDKILDVPRMNVHVLEVSDTMNARHGKMDMMESKKATIKQLISDKISTSHFDSKQTTIDHGIVKTSLIVHGETTLHDVTKLSDTQCNGTFQLTDRIESKIGQPIQFQQTVQFHRATCLSHYQYFIFNMQQSSVAKPFRVDIEDNVSALIIDSDVTNIVSLDIRLPASPLRGQVIVISTNPSISNVQIRASAMVLNQPTTMAMGSYAQFIFIEQPNRWFRIG